MKKFLMIVGGVVLSIILFFVIIFVIVSMTSKKLKCDSAEGKINIYYNDETLTGYTANGISFDLDTQKQVAEQIGIEEYLEDFSTWFKNNTSGSCRK